VKEGEMRRFGIAIILFAITSFMLTSCGGDGGGETARTTEPGGTTATTSGEANGTGSTELDSLLAKQKKASIKVTYETHDGDTVTIANDGSADPPKTSFTQGDTMTISAEGNNMISCSGIDGESPSCTEIPVGGNFLITATAGLFGGFGLFLFAADEAEQVPFLDVDKSSDEVAGRPATCITWNLSKLGQAFADNLEAGDAVTFAGCFDDETGWPLKYETQDKDGKTVDGLEATDVSEPSASDFEPPVTPETIPDIGDITIPSIPGS
jgi:hypothetical protein